MAYFNNYSMLTDYYEFTMANGYFENGCGSEIAILEMFFRKVPDGGGFAVVAGQIQKLAEQSNESARQIEEITNILIEESQKSVKTMEDVRSVIERQNTNVQNTQHAFENVKNGIDCSIDGIRTIAGKTAKLDEARVKVVDVVQNLTAIAQENAASTEETCASASEVGSIMSNIADNAEHLHQIAVKLEESVNQFVVE